MALSPRQNFSTMHTRFSQNLRSKLVLMKCHFHFYSFEKLETWYVSRYRWYNIGDVKWPGSYFRAGSTFCRPAFCRLVFRIVILWDVEPKFLGQTSDVSIDSFTKFCEFLMLRREGGSGGQINKFGLYQSPTCHGVTTFYGIAKSSFMTKIWRVKVRGYYLVPYKM